MVRRVLRRRHGESSDRGAAAIEFALVVPFLCLLVFGIISYGLMLSFRQAMSQGAAEGARAAAVTFLEEEKQGAGVDGVNAALESFGVTCDAGDLRRDGDDVGDCTVTEPGPCVPAAGEGIECVKVTLVYDYEDFPLAPSFPGLGLALPDTLTYSAQARVS